VEKSQSLKHNNTSLAPHWDKQTSIRISGVVSYPIDRHPCQGLNGRICDLNSCDSIVNAIRTVRIQKLLLVRLVFTRVNPTMVALMLYGRPTYTCPEINAYRAPQHHTFASRARNPARYLDAGIARSLQVNLALR
jgi:hypothetical protein